MIEKEDNKIPNVPNLRFKEYTGSWKKYSLKSFTKRVTRKNVGQASKRPLTISAQYGLIDQSEFFDRQIASKDMSGYYFLKNGEFAYNKSYSNDYPWGAVKRLDKYDCGALSTLYICFSLDDSIVYSDFLSHYFETNKWHKGVSDIAGEGARNHGLLNMSVEDYFLTKHYIPSMNEQEKISHFLNLVTTRIEAQSKIIEDLRFLKKELMDYILNKYAFSVISLKEFIELRYARIIKPSELEPFDGIKQYLSTSSIGENGIEQIETIITYDSRPSRASMKPIKGSIWFAKMKDTIKVYQSKDEDENIYVLSTGFYGILCDEKKVNSSWIFEIFKSKYFNIQKDRFSEGSSMSGIKDNQLSDINIKLFKNKDEESFCIQALSLISKKIEIESKLLEKYKEQKKYLLDNMFI